MHVEQSKVFVWILVLTISVGVTALSTTVVRAQRPQTRSSKARRYVCPMHPEVTSRKRGRCPKCGMALRLTSNAPANSAMSKTAPAGEAIPMPSVRIPDVRVYDQDSKPLNFYSDLVKGKTVAINFIFTTCTGVCPPMTATFRRVQQNLPAHTPPIQLISISVDPETDTPERMRDFAAKFKAGPGWTFVTGNKNEIETLLQALGTAVADKTDHTPMILIGNEVADYWTRAYGLSSPTTLIQAIMAAANHKMIATP